MLMIMDDGTIRSFSPDPDIQRTLRSLVKNQKPLGRDFEKVWDENTDKLYEK